MQIEQITVHNIREREKKEYTQQIDYMLNLLKFRLIKNQRNEYKPRFNPKYYQKQTETFVYNKITVGSLLTNNKKFCCLYNCIKLLKIQNFL